MYCSIKKINEKLQKIQKAIFIEIIRLIIATIFDGLLKMGPVHLTDSHFTDIYLSLLRVEEPTSQICI